MATRSDFMTDYPEEVLAWMKDREKKHLPYNGNSPQISSREEMVDLICTVSEKRQLTVATTHLAVYLLDRFMDNHLITESQLKLTALAVILLAAKFEEKDVNVPGIPTLTLMINNPPPKAFFISMEKFILKFFNWNVGTVTVAHFAEFYLMRGVSTGEIMNGAPITNVTHAGQLLWSLTSYFVDLSLHDRVFLMWPASVVAAACVACGRHCCSFEPLWSATLEETTGCSLQSLSHIMDHFWRMSKHDGSISTCSTPESGYGGSRCSLEGTP